jgi:hypothetical protein
MTQGPSLSGREELIGCFFHQQNQELLSEFREHLAHMDRRSQLADASGIHDEAVLDRLIALGIGPETLAALAPLVEVAWADGKVSAAEREAIVAATEAGGILSEDDASQLLAQWLTEKPGSQMLEAWKHYVSTLCQALDAQAAETLKHDLLDRAHAVAEATGGILGLGNRVSKEEKHVLDQMEQAFS